ncbi:MAG: CCA tRNA nucleotidyltransferase [Lachnospiraceae bacterium]|nr:CCA tRNA nucleotidyltransferase [Lachnospiraceae bacterium]
MKIQMPANANRIIHTLQEAGYEAYIVGGCVRDAILGKEPGDWDITTSAKPEEVKALFRRTIDTGIEHGTVTVMLDKEGYEVTTYRVDGKYEDHRRPTSVTFTASLVEDMKRRDFTINAMAYNETEGVIDHFDGMKDLERKIIRCVGEPKERFDEDALRILRALRFSAQLDFAIDEKTKEAIRNQAVYLKDISAERIHVELTKLLVSSHPERLRTAYELGVTKIVLPEFDAMMETEQNNKHHMYTVGEHTLRVVQEVPATETLRWAALLHDVAKPRTKTSDETGDHFYEHNRVGVDMAEEILQRLKFDNVTIGRVKRLVLWHDYGMGKVPSLRSFRKSLSKMGADLFEDYTYIKRADTLAQSDYMKEEKLANLEVLKEHYKTVMEQQQCLSLKDLAVGGKDLIGMGMKPGKELGEMLAYLLEVVLEEPEMNTKDALCELVKERMNSKM